MKFYGGEEDVKVRSNILILYNYALSNILELRRKVKCNTIVTID
jgi:hypothetical protein